MRAAYDLNCPPESLAMTQLQEANFMATTNHGAAYGVSGGSHCSARVVRFFALNLVRDVGNEVRVLPADARERSNAATDKRSRGDAGRRHRRPPLGKERTK